MPSIPHKVVIVTGAAHGIGSAIALAFARQRVGVVAVDIDSEVEALTRSQPEITSDHLWPVQADCTSTRQLSHLMSEIQLRWQRIDVLVNSAGGFGRWAETADVDDEEWERMITLNLSSVFRCSRAVIPTMSKQQSGRIINIASQAGVTPNPHAPSYVPYGTAKAGVLGFTRLLAKELGPQGITVNAISPGTVATARVRALRDAASLQTIARQNPLRTLIDVEDCAAAALFLASDAARHITGINLNINAGSVMV